MRLISKRLTAAFVAIAMIVTVLPAFASSASADEGGSGFFWDMDFSKNFGGSGHDHFYAVVATNDGGFIAVGYAEEAAFASPNQTAGPNDTGDWVAKGGEDAIAVKFNSDGKIDWQKNFGGSGNDRFYGVALCANGSGFAAVGYSDNDSFDNGGPNGPTVGAGSDYSGDWLGIGGYGRTDAIIVKFDNNGNVEGKSNLGGLYGDYFIGEGDDHFYGVVATSDNGFAVVGDVTLADGQTGESNYYAVIVKYDENNPEPGVVEYFGNPGGDDHFYALAEIDDHHYVAVGQTGSLQDVTNPGLNALVVMYEITEGPVGAGNDGQIGINADWKVFGGPGEDCFLGVAVGADGGFAAVGYSTEGSFDNGGQNGQAGPSGPSEYNGDWEGVAGLGGQDAIIVKYDDEGEVEGKANFGGEGNDRFYGVVATNDGGFVAVGGMTAFLGEGTGQAPEEGLDAIIVKFDSNGEQWDYSFGGSEGIDCFLGIAALPNNGGFVMVGSSDEDSFGNGDWEGVEGLGYDDAIIVKFAKIPGGNNGNGGGWLSKNWTFVAVGFIGVLVLSVAVWRIVIRRP